MWGRRAWLAGLPKGLAAALAFGPGGPAPSWAQIPPPNDPVRRDRPFTWPRDHGMHPGARIEWWYLTGWLQRSSTASSPPQTSRPSTPLAPSPEHISPWLGFQLTFFRTRTGLAEDLQGRFAPRHLVFAHAAWTDRIQQRHTHAHRSSRWSGQPGASRRVEFSGKSGQMWLDDWRLHREDSASPVGATANAAWSTRFAVAGRQFDLRLAVTQPILLQGDAGYSRKAPDAPYASHYVSEVQLLAQGTVHDGEALVPVHGRAWLDHEWSDDLLPAQAVGWDWIGINLHDGSALTAFQLRESDGRAHWAGGSHRAAGATTHRPFTSSEVSFRPLRHWRSPTTGAHYPVEWQVQCPTGPYTVKALLDGQELHDRRALTPVYWEGLAELLDATGRQLGLGYLEMTGYAGRLTL